MITVKKTSMYTKNGKGVFGIYYQQNQELKVYRFQSNSCVENPLSPGNFKNV